MIVVLQHHEPPRAEELEDFGSLKAIAPVGATSADLPRLIGAAGVFDGQHLWVDGDWLRSQGPEEHSWRMRFEDMLAFARSRGWIQAGRVRVHVG